MTRDPSARKPAEPRLAATILLLRDGPERLEVFMVERHHQIDFATGALVFPGGKLEGSDGDPSLAGHCRGAQGDAAARRHVCARRGRRPSRSAELMHRQIRRNQRCRSSGAWDRMIRDAGST